MIVWETLDVVCGSVNSFRAHRTNRTKRVERGGIFHLLIDCGWFHFSRADKKKCKRIIIAIKNEIVSPNILGRLYIYLGGPEK